MSYRTLLDQLKQISGSRTYDDTKSMVNAEDKEVNRLEDDLNYLRSQFKLVTGETNWYDAPDITAVDANTALTNAFTYTGMVDKDDSTPDYPNNNFVVDSTSLTVAVGVLDDVLNAVSSSAEVDTLDTVCDRGNTTDQSITVEGLSANGNIAVNADATAANAVITFKDDTQTETLTWASASQQFELSDDLDVTGNLTLTGTVDGVDIATWNSAAKTFTGMNADDDSTPTYSSTTYVANDDSLETAIGKLDAAIVDVDIVKEVERVASQINSGSAHTVPGGRSYTLATGVNMDLYFNGQLLQVNSGSEERDYQETSSTSVTFTFDVAIDSYLSYIIRK